MVSIRVRACVLLIEKSKILLVPHLEHDRPPVWNLPGGGVEPLERLGAATTRETLEETGLEVVLGDLYGVFECIEADYHGVAVVYQAKVVKGTLRAEPSRWGPKLAQWFSQEELPDVVDYLRGAVKGAFEGT